MAFTVVNTPSVFGNYRIVILDVTADASTQTVQTGLQKIVGHVIGPQSLSTAAIKVYANSSASGVAAMGSLGISGCVNGDKFYVVCIGA